MCEPCAAGTYSSAYGADSDEHCMRCRGGTFSTGIGQQNLSVCLSCPAGTSSSLQGDSCNACPERTFCPLGSERPVICEDPGLICDGKNLQAQPGMLPVLFGNCTGALPCPNGTRCAEGLKDKGILELDDVSQTHFLIFLGGPLRVKLGCGQDFSYGYTRLNLPSEADQAGQKALFRLLPYGCHAGSFLSGEHCQPCSVGTFSREFGALDESTCQSCPKGAFSGSVNSTACHKCSPGTFQDGNGGSSCIECGAGSFQGDQGATICLACDAGGHQPAAGGSSCLYCPSGTFQPDPGSSSCVVCDNQTQYSSQGETTCYQCGAASSALSDCAPTPLPKTESVWIEVTGQYGDECAAIGGKGFADTDLISASVVRLHPAAVCRHTLRVTGRPELSSSVLIEPQPFPDHLSDEPVRVIPFNQTFYPGLCKRTGFSVLYRPVDTRGASFDVLDSTGRHLLFHGKCRQGLCSTTAFCPTIGVLVRVTLDGGAQANVSIGAGEGLQCPPPGGWIGSVALSNPFVPYLPEDVLEFDVRVLNPPDRLLAFKLVLQIRPGFTFIAFHSVLPVETRVTSNVLTISGDISNTVLVNGLLGALTLRLDAQHSGLLRALHVAAGGFQFMMGEQGRWFAVGLMGEGFNCLQNGFVEVLTDYPRATSLILSPQWTRLVHWRGVQETARVFSTRVSVQGVWNTGRMPEDVTATCKTMTPEILEVTSCDWISARGVGSGRVSVRFEDVTRELQFKAVQPQDVSASFLPSGDRRSGRLQVLGSLFGHRLVITPFVLSVDDTVVCPPGFTGKMSMGGPVLFEWECAEPDTRVDTLFLFAGGWTAGGAFKLKPSLLASDSDEASILLFRTGSVVLGARPIWSLDPERLEARGSTVSLVRQGLSPRCSLLTDGLNNWVVPVMPPAPMTLLVNLSTRVMVVQQDHWRLVPSRTSMVSGTLLFSDGTGLDVGRRLTWTASQLLRVGNGFVETGYEPGQANITVTLPGTTCVTSIITVSIHVSSVVSGELVCRACPSLLAERDDPLSQRLPRLFPSTIYSDQFVFRRLLVDGRIHEALEQLDIDGGVQEQAGVVATRAGMLKISTQDSTISIPVVRRWVTGWVLLCNAKVCDREMKLAPPGDGAGLQPFGYTTGLVLSFELTLFNGTKLLFNDLPDVFLAVNGSDTPFPVVPLSSPGELHVSVVFGVKWEFLQSKTDFRLRVHSLASLRLVSPHILHQLHCSRIWEKASVTLTAMLTDGVEAAVILHARLQSDGHVLRLEKQSLHALRAGQGWVNASFAGLQTRAEVLVTMESLLFTGLSLDAVPEIWNAPLSSRLPLDVLLSPAMSAWQPALLQRRVIRWQASPRGVLDFLETDELVLRSDFFEPVMVHAVIRSCQGQAPIVFDKAVQVNVIPDRPWQVDFGEEQGQPLPRVRVGDVLDIPLFVFCQQPLVSYAAVVYLQGLDTSQSYCVPGELPFATCVQENGVMNLTGQFPASQRTGRVLIGTLRGRVLLNGHSRLWVSLGDPGNTTYEFTVRLGVEPVSSLQTVANSVTAGSPQPKPVSWSGPVPESLQACCDVLASRTDSNIAHLISPSFSLTKLWLLPDGEELTLLDPRIQVRYDAWALGFKLETGTWHVKRDALADFSTIHLVYHHPGTLEERSASIQVTLTAAQNILFSLPEMHLRRLHCSDNSFQATRLNVSLSLLGGSTLHLPAAELAHATMLDPGVARARIVGNDSLLVEGLSVGNTSLVLSRFGMLARCSVVVLNQSIVLRSVSMPNPYILSTAYNESQPLEITGKLDDMMENITDARFAMPEITFSEPVASWAAGSLTALKNTHPLSSQPVVIQAVIPACAGSPVLIVSSRLEVRLTAKRDSIADVVVAPGLDSFNVSLAGPAVSAFLITLRTDPAPRSCGPGNETPNFFDCVIRHDVLILGGVFPAPQPGPVLLAVVSPMPARISGYVEHFSGTSSHVLPVVAGRFGDLPFSRPATLPIIDPGTLARLYYTALMHPWDQKAGRDAEFGLQLLVGRQRVVDARLYSNEFEVSAMFESTDRFFSPDANTTSISVLFHTSELPAHPQGVEIPGVGVRVPAEHVVDGWYAVQWIGRIPRLKIRVSYEISTDTSLSPWQHELADLFVTGRPSHACPRVATDRASFLVIYKLAALPESLACVAQVAPRRVSISGPGTDGLFTASIALESFIRMHQTHVAITMNDGKQRRRLLQAPEPERVGLLYINDTADPPIPCPHGAYYTQNGTYERLPLHASTGPDCYGMACFAGYSLIDGQCVPNTVNLSIAWVCVSVIFGLIMLVSCVLCALHMGRRQPAQPLDVVSESWPDSEHPSEPFVEDDRDFKNIVLGSYMDDYSKEILDDDFMVEPLESLDSCRTANK